MRPPQSELDFILQKDKLEWLGSEIGRTQWQILHQYDHQDREELDIWSALLTEEAREEALGSENWDLSVGEGRPGFTRQYADVKTETVYSPFGNISRFRPIIHWRQFGGAASEYAEIEQEFRLYHNLTYSAGLSALVGFDSSGRPLEAVKISENLIQAHLRYLRSFQASTRLSLVIFIDCRRYSHMLLEQIPSDKRDLLQKGCDSRWSCSVGMCDFWKDYTVFSRLLGKRILTPPPVEKSEIWPFSKLKSEEGEEVQFVVGLDSDGGEILHSSNHHRLAPPFLATPDVPQYLTPVFFRREVLDKYYAEPSRYEVRDGYLKCLDLWGCAIDNDSKNWVSVFLGDLGRDMPYKERLHWKQFNIYPEKQSYTSFNRNFGAGFAEAQSIDLRFRREYERFAEDWEKEIGWPMFRAPTSEDRHLIRTVKVPAGENQSDFDQQVLVLTKLLVDSLNESELQARAGHLPDGAKGIKKLEGFFKETGFLEGPSVVGFLKHLQNLRSTGAAHRKGSGYQRAQRALGIESMSIPDRVRCLLVGATEYIRRIDGHYLS